MKPITAEWVEKAEGDYKVAEDERKTQGPVLDAVCFHSQQCVEKYLKAWLTQQEFLFPRIHDLEALGKLALPSLPDLNAMMEDLIFLSSASVEVRYPGAAASMEEAEESVRIMSEVRSLIRKNLKVEGEKT